MSDIFISYRRSDTEMAAGRLCDQLKRVLGDDAVFIDTEGIPAGVEFVDELADRLSACQVFLAIIGPRWTQVRAGIQRRVMRPGDFVRLEVFAALNRNIKIIPILVSGAQMPSVKALPASIARLSEIQAVRLFTDTFVQDVNTIVAQIRVELASKAVRTDEEVKKERDRIRALLRANLAEEETRITRRSVITAAAIALPSAGLAYVGLRKPPNTNQPRFAQPLQDATEFHVPHGSDEENYRIIDKVNEAHKYRPLQFRRSRGGVEPILSLSDIFGSRGPEVIANIARNNELCFHSLGCTGGTESPANMALVANMLASEINGESSKALAIKPTFLFHLGDVIYSFGEEVYYYDQFYYPYRNYLGPIVAIPGNHDGMIKPGDPEQTSLASFFEHFCAEEFKPALPSAIDTIRTPQIQPGVYFTLEAPFARIIALYTNVLQDPGVIAGETIGRAQLEFLEAALLRIRRDNYPGAVILAHHHPAYSLGSLHGWSIEMIQQIDAICAKTDVWPHVVLSAHAHNYQRFTRRVASREMPYIICGNGGHAVANLQGDNDFQRPKTRLALILAPRMTILQLRTMMTKILDSSG